MTCSAERLAANRANALKSTGPRTPEGKVISRRNGLKHGLTGEGIALPDEDAGEVERRFAAFEAELAPQTELGRTLTLRVAMLAVRLERCYRNEAARLTAAVDSAGKAFEEDRISGLNALMDGLADDPATNAWRLQQSPDGVELTIEAWKSLKLDLMDPDRKLWNAAHRERAENLLGRRPDDLPRSRIGALSRALWYDFSALDPHEASDLNDQGKYEYARDRMAEIIDRRVEILSGALASGQFDGAAADRAKAGATDRALFDTLPESILARKYEGATERSLFRTLREFREVEATAVAVEPNPEAADLNPSSTEVCGALGSSLPGAVAAVVADPSPAPPSAEEAVSRGSEGPARRFGGSRKRRPGPG